MVFSEPGQILACLEIIAVDREVEVVRVNNKLARGYDAGLTAGYRCTPAPPYLGETPRKAPPPQLSCAGWQLSTFRSTEK